MGRHRSTTKRRGVPVRTGLLGASAAVAMGAVAMASGLLPGGDTLVTGGEAAPGKAVGSQGPPTLQTQGDSGSAATAGTPGSGPSAPHLPSRSPSGSPAAKKPSPSPSEREKADAAARERAEREAPASRKATVPAQRTGGHDTADSKRSAPPAPKSKAPERKRTAATTTESAMEAEVLELVNQERAKAGCAPLRYDAGLAKLAGNFSSDMAGRGFFDHTDPDGDTPWDRAEQAGVKNLAAENIARGQGDAAAVMDAWMKSEGHRANILNCDYKTLGVGVHLGDGGPWWTQNFGY
ncbi:CAP domain-containing protein [Streptomyces sp. NPDC020875]|uniref:CAP domain-containing protein n=1 Tax=Streptomyces sp. NPDC020875 TaxID=3154898 RepID=UPI0033F542F1